MSDSQFRVRAPFCDTAGAEMADEMDFTVYLDQLEEEKKEGNDGESPTAVGNILKVYYKKRNVRTKINDATTEFLKKQIDLKIREAPELKDVRAELLSSSFMESKWKVDTSGRRSIAANLTESDWIVITRTNRLLSGYKVTFTEAHNNAKKLIPTGVERTPFNAFKLRPRSFDDYEVASQTAPGKGARISTEVVALRFHIPRFRVDNTAKITVTEMKNAVASSMAESSFSETSLKLSAAAGFWGVSAAAKGGYTEGHEDKGLTADSESHHKVHISYNFPRVTVFLDASSLELTAEVKEDIAKVQDKDSLEIFRQKYGDIFSRKVTLGGKLSSSSNVDANGNTTAAERENALKVAAAAAVSGKYGSFDGEGKGASGDKHKESTETEKLESNLTWAAIGGDTTLCNIPHEWCGTVGDFYNWRVVEHDSPIPLAKLISTFKGFEHVEEQFELAAGYGDGVSVWK